MKLNDLAVKRDYEPQSVNYYGDNGGQFFFTFEEFSKKYLNADINTDLIVRWDIVYFEADKGYYMEIHMLHQDTGKYSPIRIQSVTEEDVPHIIKLLTFHFEKIKRLWFPLSDI